ncbi:MAG: PLP-dependent aminotransferase family protein [Deltaproteobacteria bacterium]|nr:PLP-dependent aminotransferase family protein [Deltaproteobacteria bacterium]
MKMYNFYGGQTCPESIPVDGLIEATKRILPSKARLFVNYDFQVNQHEELKQVVSEWIERRGDIHMPPSKIIITTGSMLAITCVVNVFTKPGDTVITDELAFMGALNSFRHFGLNTIGVPMDEKDGMDIDALEETLRILSSKKIEPKLIYTTANYHNPTTAVLSVPRRERMIELAKRYNVMILDDDCYGGVNLEEEPTPKTLYALGDQKSIIHMGSFSKIVAPGLRLGYLIVPELFTEPTIAVKNIFEGGTSFFVSSILAEYLRDNLWSHVERHNAIVKTKRDVTLEALSEHLSGFASWVKPRGGLFVWVRLPETLDTHRLEKLAKHSGVRYDPGRIFSTYQKEINCLRLSYAHMSEDEIRQGIKLLADCVTRCLDEQAKGETSSN